MLSETERQKKEKKKMVSFCKQSTAHLLKQVTTSDKIMRNQRIMQCIQS